MSSKGNWKSRGRPRSPTSRTPSASSTSLVGGGVRILDADEDLAVSAPEGGMGVLGAWNLDSRPPAAAVRCLGLLYGGCRRSFGNGLNVCRATHCFMGPPSFFGGIFVLVSLVFRCVGEDHARLAGRKKYRPGCFWGRSWRSAGRACYTSPTFVATRRDDKHTPDAYIKAWSGLARTFPPAGSYITHKCLPSCQRWALKS